MSLSPDIDQIVPSRFRNSGQLRDGGVLVVGASATGVQLASEIAGTGRRVMLAVGRHIRLPRSYRGRDIMAWFDDMGVLTADIHQVRDIKASRAQPSLQLIGSDDHHSLDLGVLLQQGVRLVGRLTGVLGRKVYMADDLAASVDRAQMKMNEQLDRVDDFIEQKGWGRFFPTEDRPCHIHAPHAPAALDLAAEGIGTVLWATGYRREYPWLRVPVLDAAGELEHDGGITAEAGLYALGLQFMRRRNSSFIDGVGADAIALAAHIRDRVSRRPAVA